MNATYAGDIASLRLSQPKMPGTTGASNPEEARKAAENFEAVFVSQMVSHMFAGIKEDEMFGGGQAGDMYRSMLNDEYGRAIAKSGGIGVANQVMQQILKMQEGSST